MIKPYSTLVFLCILSIFEIAQACPSSSDMRGLLKEWEDKNVRGGDIEKVKTDGQTWEGTVKFYHQMNIHALNHILENEKIRDNVRDEVSKQGDMCVFHFTSPLGGKVMTFTSKAVAGD